MYHIYEVVQTGINVSDGIVNSAFATSSSQQSASYTEVAYQSLPDDVKSIVSEDAEIYVDSYGNYTVYQNSTNSYRTQYVVQSTMGRYAPNGGTYTDSYYSGPNLLLSQSYIPAQAVLNYAVGSTEGAVAQILNSAAAGATTGAIVKLLGLSFGLTVPGWFVEGVVLASGISYYAIFEMNKNTALEKLRDSNNKGIHVKQFMTTSGAEVRVIEAWSNHPYVPLYPNGTTGTWEAGVNYAI